MNGQVSFIIVDFKFAAAAVEYVAPAWLPEETNSSSNCRLTSPTEFWLPAPRFLL